MRTSNNKDRYGFLFKDVKEYNKYLLTLVCCSILVLTGIISYMVTNSYAKWSSSYVSDNTLKLTATRKKLTDVVKSRVGKDGVVSINQAKTGQITYDSVDYRYSGSNDSVNNYIDFNDETWRIIGVFTVDDGNGGTEERVKIIREKPLNMLKAYGYSYGRWYYNSSSYLSNSYSYYYLNNTYYNTINSKYRKLMADTNYYLGITSSYSSINASTAYTAERASKSTSYNPQYQSAKVGLMYASDYGYAADSSCHGTAIYSYNSSCVDKDWLYGSVYSKAAYTYTGSSTASYELLMTGYSGSYANTLNVTTGSNYRSSYSSSYLVRPTVYLKASTTLESGNGTKDNHYKVKLFENLDKSGANEPSLTSNMIPVYYDSASDSWKKADSNNAKEANKWYDYDNKMWANAVTVTSTNRDAYLKADAGTTIPMSDINTMWVWVPRYTYTYLNTNTPQEINVKFESGTASSGTIKCTDNVTGTSSTSETCTDTTNGGLKAGTSTYTHPAFWWDKNDNNVRETGEELTGIWVGKFEVSSDTSCTPNTSDAVGSGCNLQTIRPQIKPNVTSWRGAQVGTFFNGIQQMRESGNKYGFATTDETHMMKNMEWGAVTYLSHSKYGINKEVAINSKNTYTTGCGPQSAGSTTSGATCYSYTTALGQSASTTGNVYGVYDMSGGAHEYMMGNMVWSNGQQMSGYQTSNNYNSAFTGILYDGGTSFTGTYAFPSKRYYDKYSYDASSNISYTRGKLGDATKEMAPTGKTGNWYGDYANFVYSGSPWVLRGGSFFNGAVAGAFNFIFSDGYANTDASARAVLLGAGALD